MVEEGGDWFPEVRFYYQNDCDDEEAELESSLPELKAINGEND